MAIFGLTVSFAAGLRLYRLDAYPSGIHIDEVALAPFALNILNGKFISPFANTNFANLGLFPYTQVPFIALMGHTITALRLESALAGLAAFPIFYLLVRRLFGVRIALLALALLAGNAVTNAYGRHGDLLVFALPLGSLIMYSLWEAQRTQQLGWWFVTGILSGLTIYFYFPAQVIAAVALVYVAYLFAVHRDVRRAWVRGSCLAALGAAAATMPVLVNLRRQGPGLNKAGIDLIFNNWPLASQQQHASSVAGVLIGQIRTNFLDFFSGRGGDINDFTSYTHSPMLASLLGPFVVLGLVLIAFRLQDRRYVLLLIWFCFVVLIPGALGVDSPRSWRLLPALLPAVCIVALALEWVIAEAPGLLGVRITVPLVFGSAMVVVAAGYVDQANFFWTARTERPWEDSTLQGTYIASLGKDYRAYVMGNPSMYYNAWPKFLAPDTPGSDLQNAGDLPLPVRDDRNLAFLVYGSMRDSLPLLRLAYPSGTTQDEYVRSGVSFTSYLVPNSDIVRRQGLSANYSGEGPYLESDPAELSSQAPAFARHTWTGSIYAARNGPYVLRAAGASELILDGAPLQPTDQRELWIGWHPIAITAPQGSRDGPISLLWQPPDGPMAAIPKEQLYAEVLPNTLRATLQMPDGQTRKRWDHAIGFRNAAALWGVDKPTTVTWQGTLNVPSTGDYTIGITSQGAASMSLDEQVVVTNAEPSGIQIAKSVRRLMAGPHSLSVRYAWLRDAAIVEAFWTPPGGEESIIPWTAFGPPA